VGKKKAVVPAADIGKPGPAMERLTKKQQKYVMCLAETGGHNHARAARSAGYTGTDQTIRTTAYRLAHDPRILEALKEIADRRIRSGALLGASVLMEIAGDTMHKHRFHAAKELLDRSGLMVVTEHKVTVQNSSDEKAIIDRIASMAAQLGIDHKALLGNIVEAEFEEVKPKELAAPFDPAAGLEDLL